jgi:tRNA nucleotidyltransferase (CCA-adding enzyme)
MEKTAFLEALNAQPRVLVEAIQHVAEGVRRLPPTPGQPRALLVGGLVRDLLLGLPMTDVDMEIHGVEIHVLHAMLEELFPDRVFDVGRAFNVFKIALDAGHALDVSIPRRDSKIGTGHKGFEITTDPFMSIEDATRRRDFTINSLLADPLTGEIIDPFDGIKDLTNRILRVTDPMTFGEDPLRIYRAVQFAARFGMTVDHKTFDLLQKMVARGDLDQLPKERITEELRKLFLKAEKPSVGLQLMWDLGIVERDYPELYALKATPQEPAWHPEGDVWIHSLMVVDQAAKNVRQPERRLNDDQKLKAVLGAFCHDLGKPATTKEMEGKIRSLEHEAAGEEPARSLMARWTFGADVDAAVIAIAKDHLKPGMLLREYEKGNMTDDQYDNAVRRLLKRIYPLDYRTYLAACEADYRGRSLPEVQAGPYVAGEKFAESVVRNKLDIDPPKPLLRGEDLLELGIQPGVEMGRIIREVEEARDRGEVKTREEAVKWIKKQKPL